MRDEMKIIYLVLLKSKLTAEFFSGYSSLVMEMGSLKVDLNTVYKYIVNNNIEILK